MKFLRGKVWQIVLAVCMLVVLLCITASAADSSGLVELYLGDNDIDLVQGETRYFTTNSSGGITESQTPIDNWNIKLEFAEGDDAVPTMTLRNTRLNAHGGRYFSLVSQSNTEDTFRIVVEKVDSPSITNYPDVDAVFTHGITWKHGNLEIRGYTGDTAPENSADLGRLTLQTPYNSINASSAVNITFDHVNLVMNNLATDTTRNCIATPGLVTFNGGIARLTSVKGYAIQNAAGGVLFTGNVDAELKSTENQAVTYSKPGQFVVESGNVTIKSEQGIAIVSSSNSNSLIVNGGTLTIHGGSYLSDGTGQIVPNGYLNTEGEANYYMSYSTEYDGTDAQEFRIGAVAWGGKKYFKIEPTYTVNVTDGTADKAKYTVGATVMLTPADKGASVFNGWVVADDSAEIEINEDNGVYTFVMPEGNVNVTADYIETATISLAGTNYTFTEGESVYFTTDANGVVTKITEGDLENLYNIKLTFVNDVPTMYLRGATIIDEQKAVVLDANAPTFVIVTEGASTIKHTVDEKTNNPSSTGNSKRAAITFYKQLVFRGTAPLNLVGANNSIYGAASGANVLFDHTNVNLRTTYGRWAEANIAGSVASVVVDGGIVNATADSYMVAWGISKMPFTVRGDAKVSLKSSSSLLTYYGVSLNIESGYVYAEGKASAADTIFRESTVTIGGNGILEAKNVTAGGAIMPAKPTVPDGMYIVMGDSKQTATSGIYTNAATPNKQYLAVGKSVTVNVTGGTAQAFGSPATEITAIAGIDVTVTTVKQDNVKFNGWTASDNNVTFADAGALTTTFKPIGDVTVTANHVKEAAVKLRGVEYTISDVAAYYTTDGTGAIVASDAENYTIKLVYNGNMPTVYLKNANISYTESVIETGTGTTEFAIETEAPSTLFQTGVDLSAEDEARGAVKASGKVIFRGDDLLTLKGYANAIFGVSSAEILFENANVAVTKVLAGGESNNGGWYEQAMYGSFKSITFSGGKATLTATRILCSAGTTITVTGGANVSMTAPNITLYGGPTFNVVDGDLYAKGTSTSALFHQTSGITVSENGVFEAVHNGPILEKLPILFDGYYAVMGDSKEAATVYETGNLTGKYFKVGKPVTVTVTDGTAKGPYAAAAAGTATVIVGDSVTLTANEAASGTAFIKWTYTDSGETFTDVSDATGTFTPTGDVSVEANYEVRASIGILANTYSFSESQAVYFTTDSNGNVTRITEGDLESRYNIKLALVNGIPTAFLRNATITSDSASYGNAPLHSDTGISHMVIEVQQASTLNSVGCGIYVEKSDLTIKGPGKLTINSNTGGTQTYGSGAGILLRHYYDTDPEDKKVARTITLESQANLSINTPGTGNEAPTCIWNEPWNQIPNLVIQAGVTLEMNAGKGLSSYNLTPTISGDYTDWAAVNGTSKETATGYVAGANLAGLYFKIAPGYVVTVQEGQASGLSNGGRAFPGAKVTLTPDAAPAANQMFTEWEFEEGSLTPTITSNVFTMPEGNVSVVATYELFATMNILGANHNFTVSKPLYFTTTDGAVTKITDGDLENIYNVKLAFADGVPTVFLKGATITSTSSTIYPIQNGANVSHFVVVTEQASTLNGYGRAIYLNRSNMTLKGPGKLTVIGNNTASSGFGAGSAIFVYQYHTTNDPVENRIARTITIGADADVYIKSNAASTGGIWGEYGYIEEDKEKTGQTNANVVVVGGSSLEIESASNIVYPGVNLTFQDYANWAGVIGDSKETATGYNGGANPTRGSKYFKIAPGYVVNITGGTSATLSNGNRAFEGAVVKLTPGAAPSATQAFYQWESEDISITGNTFTMGDSDVTITSTYQKKATVYFRAAATTANILEYTPTYYKTVDGALQLSTASDYNIKLIFTDDIPTIYMKGAEITTTGSYGLSAGSAQLSHLVIVVDEDSSITNNGSGAGISLDKVNLTIKGPGKLSIETTATNGYGAIAGILLYEGDAGKTITLGDDADVYIKTVGTSTAGIYTDKNAVNSTLAMQGGKIEFNTNSRPAYPGLHIDWTGYDNWAAIGGASAETADAHKTLSALPTQKYFKIAPGYDVTVINGTANVLRAFEGMKITVTADAAQAGMGLKNWTSNTYALSESEKYAESFTFTMPNNAVDLTASYGDLAKVRLNGGATWYNVVQGGADRYYTVDGSGNIVVADSNVTDNYVKFAYAEDGKPTLTLKNVRLNKSTYGAIGSIDAGEDTPELVIELLGENYAGDTAWSTIIFQGNNLTFTGDGSINIVSNYKGILMERKNLDDAFGGVSTLTFDNVNMHITARGGYQGCINVGATNVNVNGGNLTLIAGPQTFNDDGSEKAHGGSAFAGSGNLTIDDNAIVNIPTAYGAIGMNLVMEDGILRIGMTLNEGTPEEIVGDVRWCFTGNIQINGGQIEAAGIDGVGYKAATIDPNYDCLAIEAPSKAAFEANPSQYIYDGNLLYDHYFRVDPKEVKVTITWGAMSFTYSGAIWNVETLQWEGNWVPDAGVSEGLVSNQIHVENIGTDTVLVSFEFAPTQGVLSNNVNGVFVDSADNAYVNGYELTRFKETNAFLKLNSQTVDAFANNTTLGIVTIRIDALTPAQGGNA